MLVGVKNVTVNDIGIGNVWTNVGGCVGKTEKLKNSFVNGPIEVSLLVKQVYSKHTLFYEKLYE